MIALFSALAGITDQVGQKFGAIGVNEFQGQLTSATATTQMLGYDFDAMAGSVSSL